MNKKSIFHHQAANQYPERLRNGSQYDDTKKLTKWLNDRKKDEHCMKGVKFIPAKKEN